MICVHAVSYVLPHCDQEREEFDETVVHDADDPNIVRVPLHDPGSTTPGPAVLVAAQPESAAPGPAVLVAARPESRIPRKLEPAKQEPGPAATRKRCRDFETPDGCSAEDCQLAHGAKVRVICRDFNSSKGCKRTSCIHLHEVRASSITKCKYQMKVGGCRRGAACPDRHVAQAKEAQRPPQDLCDLRSQGQFEYVPTRDNIKVAQDVRSQHWGRVQDAASAYTGKAPHIQMILFDMDTHRPLGVLVFGGSVCLDWMADACPPHGCGDKNCEYWHAPLGSLHSDLARAPGTHRLMEGREEYLRGLLRCVGKSLKQPVYELGGPDVARLATLVERNRKFDVSVNRAAFTQIRSEAAYASKAPATGYDERVRIIRGQNLTVAQLDEILSDETKMLEFSMVPGQALSTFGNDSVPEMAAPTMGGVDIRSMLANDDDDRESVSVVSEATQRTMVGISGVLTTMEDYVKHVEALKSYEGVRLKKALVRYPADAQQAFDKYAGAAIIHYERNKVLARDIHAYQVGLKEYKLRSAEGSGSDAARRKLSTMFKGVDEGLCQFDDEKKQLSVRERKMKNTALLARALQPLWQARSTSAFQAAIQQHDSPAAAYKHRSSTALFWINMHRLAIGDDAFALEGFVSLAGDIVRKY